MGGGESRAADSTPGGQPGRKCNRESGQAIQAARLSGMGPGLPTRVVNMWGVWGLA